MRKRTARIRAAGIMAALAALGWVGVRASRPTPEIPASAPAPASVSAAASVSVAAPVPASAPVPVPVSAPASVPASASASASPPPKPSPCPEGMALVDHFCVDRFEAHLVATTSAGEILSHPHHKRPEPGVHYIAQSAPGVFPQAYISRVEAKAACEAAGKRLCSRREWMQACRGNGIYSYPYGPKGERGRCSTGKLHLLTELFGDKKGGWSYEEHFNSPELALQPGFLARAGEYTGCASELGVYDMVGNLHEWVSDMVDQSLLDLLAGEGVDRREQPWTEGNGVFMGGFFSTTNELGPGCFYTTIAHEPTYHDYSTGFRCCANAKPPAEAKPAHATKK